MNGSYNDNTMFEINYFIITLLVLDNNVQPSCEAVIHVESYTNLNGINITHQYLNDLFQCLSNTTVQSCKLLLDIPKKSSDPFGVKDIKRVNLTSRESDELIPWYKCTFSSIDIDSENFTCSRTRSDPSIQSNRTFLAFDFIILWENTADYFIDDSVVNCSINSTAFAYKYINQSKPSEISTSAGSTDVRDKACNSSATRYNSNCTSVSSSDTTYDSNIIPIICGVIVPFLLLSMVIISYIVFSHIKKTKSSKANLKSMSSPESIYHEADEDIVYTHSGQESINSVPDSVTSDNYSSIDIIDEGINIVQVRPGIYNYSAADEIIESNNSASNRDITATAGSNNEINNFEGIIPVSDHYNAVGINNDSNNSALTSKSEACFSTITNEHESTHALHEDSLELHEKNIREKAMSADLVYSRLNEQTKLLADEYGQLQNISITTRRNNTSSETAYSKLNEPTKLLTDEYGQLENIPITNSGNNTSSEPAYSKLNEPTKLLTDEYGQLENIPVTNSGNNTSSEPVYSKLNEPMKLLTDEYGY